MKNFILVLPLVAISLIGSVLAETVDSLLASRGCDMEETEEIVNLWTWPQEVAYLQNASRGTVWIPDGSKWYSNMSNQGYVQSYPSNLNGNWFAADSYHVCFHGWYLMGRYVYLEPGPYVLTYDSCCETYTDNVGNEFLAYKESGDGFIFSRQLAQKRNIVDRGEYKSTIVSFVIPSDISLVGIWMGPTSNSETRNEADIWNVVLIKVEE